MRTSTTDLLDTVHQIEDEYGSIANAPNDCWQLQYCHAIVDRFQDGRHANAVNGLVKKQQLQIEKLFLRGLTRYQISELTGLSYHVVCKRIRTMQMYEPIGR